MAIPAREFIRKYIPVYVLQDELDDIGLPIGGTKDILIDRVLQAHGLYKRDISVLISWLYKEDLQIICKRMGLDDSGLYDTLIRRIMKNIDQESFESAKADKQDAPLVPKRPNRAQQEKESSATNIFIVHGNEETSKLQLNSFLEKLNLQKNGLPVNCIILHEQPNKGKTLIEKLEENAVDIGLVFVLLTPDDVGGKANETPRQRARQNVIFEMGYFMGKLGRSKVCCLLKGEVEQPSDTFGIAYLPYGANVTEKSFEILSELSSHGYQFSL